MLTIDTDIYSPQTAADYIALCESAYEKRVTDVANYISDRRDVKIVALAGATCSGKTTTALKLTDKLDRIGIRTRILSIDDFYRDDVREDEEKDYESPSSLDLELFNSCTEKLLSGKKTYLPTFDFKIGRRGALTEYTPHDNDIYIFEGIQALYPEITAQLSAFPFVSVFTGIFDDVMLNGTLFKREEIRLARRLVRDAMFRSTGVEETFALWGGVRENEEKNIFPAAEIADYKISSYLPYETMLIGAYLVPLLRSLPQTSRYTDISCDLSERILKVTSQYFTRDLVPFGSLLREFIG